MGDGGYKIYFSVWPDNDILESQEALKRTAAGKVMEFVDDPRADINSKMHLVLGYKVYFNNYIDGMYTDF